MRLVIYTLVLLLLAGAAFAQPITDSVPQLIEQGRAALQSNDYPLATQYFEQALNQNPNSFPARFHLAETYFIQNDFSNALQEVLRAQRLNQNSLPLQILLARINTALNNFEIAQSQYAALLANNPRSITAQLGMAELAIILHKNIEAQRVYEEILAQDPDHIVALLSLSLLKEQQGDSVAAENLIVRALELQPQRLSTLNIAARHYLQNGMYQQARYFSQLASEIAPNDVATLLLRSEVEGINENYNDALQVAEQLITIDPSNAQFWYVRGTILKQLALPSEALQSFVRALNIQSDYELPRIAAETLLRNQFDLQDTQRIAFAQYRINRANEYADRYLLDQAILHYRRGLQIAPFSVEGRALLADTLQQSGFNAKYLRELEIIQSLGEESQTLLDTIETYADLLSESVAYRWDIDQFTLNKSTVRLDLIMDASRSTVTVRDTLETVGTYFLDILRFSENFQVAERAVVRDRNIDLRFNTNATDGAYNLIGYLLEASNTVQFVVELRSAQSKKVIKQYSASFVGVDRYHRAMRQVADQISQDLPLRGTIIDRENNRVVIDLGRTNGLQVDDELIAVLQDSLTVADDTIGFRYASDRTLGTVVVNALDDLIAEGTINRTGLFDNFSIGDEVIMQRAAQPYPASSVTPAPLYEQIQQIR